jgi:hypothetical protein
MPSGPWGQESSKGRVYRPGAGCSSSRVNRLEWDDPEHGKQAFLLDVLVATGKLRRANRRRVVVMHGGSRR